MRRLEDMFAKYPALQSQEVSVLEPSTLVSLGAGGSSVPRLLEPRVAAHIERGRVAMRRLEDMFAKYPALQSQEVSVLEPSTLVSLGAGGSSVPRLLEPRVAAHIERGRVAMRRLEDMFAKYPALQSQEVSVLEPSTLVSLGAGGSSVPRLLEPRVAAHIERGRVAMRRLEDMFAKYPALQSQEVSVLEPSTLVSLGAGGSSVPRLLEPRVAAHIERGRVAMRRLEDMFAKYPALQSQEVSVLEPSTLVAQGVS
ncbi:hypothetical protein JYU34_012737 [Plutella xylostella]|uniref:Uncharacterized protein n=1 Tax=Plutella xylostella TaxID=51655 RepID=A0ABQ7QC15_PLUXY|nr:hypothetical protein JYU34_012737 [Plutella xylostella]